jgi:hypothetical protein
MTCRPAAHSFTFDLRQILGWESLFMCHNVNRKKTSYFSENTSIVLQRTVPATAGSLVSPKRWGNELPRQGGLFRVFIRLTLRAAQQRLGSIVSP